MASVIFMPPSDKTAAQDTHALHRNHKTQRMGIMIDTVNTVALRLLRQYISVLLSVYCHIKIKYVIIYRSNAEIILSW